jgi:hypothetical protein
MCPPHGIFHKSAERIRASIGHDGGSNTSGVTTTPTLVELGARFALTNLNGAGDQQFVRDATAFAPRSTADIAFIDFGILALPATDPVLIRSNHAGAEFKEYLECGFVT